jgi:hypothetical protein
MLIDHLDTSNVSNRLLDIRIGVAHVLSQIIGIAAQSIGPALLEIFNSLLRHLRASVERQRVRKNSDDLVCTQVIIMFLMFF